MGHLGGILTFWDINKFVSSSQWNIRGAVVVVGRERVLGDDICILNIYAPCSDDGQLLLWDMLKLVVEQWADVKVCLIGDFNAILGPEEMIGEGGSGLSRGSRGLKEFVEEGKLHDVKFQSKRFMWYRSNGTCKTASIVLSLMING